MSPKKLIFTLISLTFLAALNSLFAADISYYSSNSIGMRLDAIDAEETDGSQGWVIESMDKVDGYIDIVLYGGSEQWRDIVTYSGDRMYVNREYPDGSSVADTYYDNLLVESEQVSHDETTGFETTLRTVNIYDAGVLSAQEIYRNGSLEVAVQYIRKANGELHMKKSLYSRTENPVELLIIGSASGSGKTAIGVHDDFSIMQTLPNGKIVTERWQSGEAVTATSSVMTDPEGDFTVTETGPGGSRTVSQYDSSGLLTEKRFSESGEDAVSYYYYDEERRLIREETVRAGTGSTYLYQYDDDGTMVKTTEYSNGMIVKIVNYKSDGVIEQVFKRGKPYIIIYYEADGITVKETELVE